MPKKMSAVSPFHALIHQSQKSLVHQRRALQRMAAPFAPQIGLRQSVQFSVDQRDQFIARSRVAVVPGDQ